MDENIYKSKALMDELADELDDEKNKGFYYSLATQYPHPFLRNILSWVNDYPNPKNKGKLFTWKLKSELAIKSIPTTEEPNHDLKNTINQWKKKNFSV